MNQGRRYSTETERIANEVYDRHSIFVDGIERTEKEIHVATEAQQADFWAGLPRVQAGVGRVGVDWGRVFTLLAIYGATLGVSGALGWGLAEIVTGLFGKGAR
jgi:hypothetical protein